MNHHFTFCMGVLLMLLPVLIPDTGFAGRPFLTEDAEVAGRHVAQLETSANYAKLDNNDRTTILRFVPIYGITQNIEISMDIPVILFDPVQGQSQEGLGDVQILSKLQILQETAQSPAVAMEWIVKADTASHETLGTSGTDHSLLLAASQELRSLEMSVMLGYTFVGSHGDKNIRDVYFYGLSLEYALSDVLELGGEITGNRARDRRSKNDPVVGLIGLVLEFSEKFQLDASARFGIRGPAPDWVASVGTTITF